MIHVSHKMIAEQGSNQYTSGKSLLKSDPLCSARKGSLAIVKELAIQFARRSVPTQAVPDSPTS